MKLKTLLCLATLLPLTTFATPHTVVGHVTEIEPSYVPDHMIFAIDQALGACHAGPWLFFNGNGAPAGNNNSENVKAVYAAVSLALATGNLVEVSGDDNGCLISSVHVLAHP
jgi:hypothetical protein